MSFEEMVELYEEWKDCTRCKLHSKRANVVFGEGNATNPKILIIGEAPGPTEDKAALPFIGTTGKELRKVLTAAGADLANDCFITNTVLCFPTNDGKDFFGPLGPEIRTCLPRLDTQVALLEPSLRVVLLLGARAIGTFLKREDLLEGKLDTDAGFNSVKVNKMIGWHEIDGASYKICAAQHPSFICRGGLNEANLVYVKWKLLLKEAVDYAYATPAG